MCEEFSGYTGDDIEIFITAYEITASIIKQTKANRAHHRCWANKQTKKNVGTKKKRGVMRNINRNDGINWIVQRPTASVIQKCCTRWRKQ